MHSEIVRKAGSSLCNFSAPVWLVGFRPFFIAACISGALFPLFWVLAYSGAFVRIGQAFDPFISALHWHKHEMFFGFGWALLGGFLLTASKNWLGIRGHHGATLGTLVLFWLLDRVAMAYGGGWSDIVVYALSIPFIFMIVTLLEIDLIRNRANDSYKDNVYFILALPLFILAKWAMLDREIDPAIGVAMTQGLFRLCFLLMLERTLEAFMKGAMGITLRRLPWIDHTIKTLGVVLIFIYNFPPSLQTLLSLLLAILMLIRWCYWHPFKALRRIDIGVMYLGYLAIAASLVIQSLMPLYGSFGLHVFTLGAIGLIAPAMIIRISNGHTGRKVVFSKIDKLAIYLMLTALLFRVGVPLLAPDLYTQCLYVSACCWLAAFTAVGYRCIPMLLGPRIDGRAH